MPDIMKCRGENCPLKTTCYRFTSNPNKIGWQSYLIRVPFDESTNQCSFHMTIPFCKLNKSNKNE